MYLYVLFVRMLMSIKFNYWGICTIGDRYNYSVTRKVYSCKYTHTDTYTDARNSSFSVETEEYFVLFK